MGVKGPVVSWWQIFALCLAASFAGSLLAGFLFLAWQRSVARKSPPPEPEPEPTKSELKQHLKDLGRKGGNERASRLTAEERSAQAKRAASFRWTKKKPEEPEQPESEGPPSES